MNRMARAMLKAALSVAVAGLAAQAETFHNKDGVVFEGTIRRVVSNAAICNVLEEKYSEQEYEKLKANQGQPLDLWQVDFTIRNESGREIDYLRASSWMHSEHPPCTNWSGQGPGRGPVLPEPSLPIPIEWGDYLPLLQKPSGMRPGQQERTSVYVVAWHEHRPRFGEWNIDYTFAKGAATGVGGAGRVGGRSARQSGSSGAAAQLPPDIQADRYLLQAEQAVRDGDAASARAAMERLGALEREHGLEPSPEDHYRYAQAWEAAGEPQRALSAAVRYLQLRGREAEHYTAALDLMNRAESGKVASAAVIRGDPGAPVGTPRVAPGAPSARRVESRAPQPPRPAEQGRPSGISAGQTCAGQAEGAACWMELANQPGCYVWNPNLSADETAAWPGECSGGLASGTGTLTWVEWYRGEKYKREDTGRLQDGKQHGRWVQRHADGRVDEGPYVDGNKHGRWVQRHAVGIVYEGPYVDGKRHGRWVISEPGSFSFEGPFVDGKMHGRWVTRYADGEVEEGPYVDDKKHGRWVMRYADGNVEIDTYVNGEKQ